MNPSESGCQLSAVSYQLSAISRQLSAVSYQPSAFSRQLSAFSQTEGFFLRAGFNRRRQAILWNDDGVVDQADLAIWQEHFGEGSGSAVTSNNAVPEPATSALTLALLGFATLMGTRARQ